MRRRLPGKMKGRQHKLTPEECAYLLQTLRDWTVQDRNTLQKHGLSNSIVVSHSGMKCGRPGVRAGAIRRGPRCGR